MRIVNCNHGDQFAAVKEVEGQVKGMVIVLVLLPIRIHPSFRWWLGGVLVAPHLTIVVAQGAAYKPTASFTVKKGFVVALGVLLYVVRPSPMFFFSLEILAQFGSLILCCLTSRAEHDGVCKKTI